MSSNATRRKQTAVQLVGPGELKINHEKEIHQPGPRQILAKVEAVGLCFSDLKVLKQFSGHVRKSAVIEGLAADELAEIPSYVPGEKPTVPGHEVVCTVVAVGSQVKNFKEGDRCLVQPDFRTLRTAGSNSAFGYNFEGGLQEYILLDERVVIDKDGQQYLIPVEPHLGASQAALVEPWACVEDSYVTPERQHIQPGGNLLVVAEKDHPVKGLAESLNTTGKPAHVTAIVSDSAQLDTIRALGVPVTEAAEIGTLPNEGFQDIVYFGAQKETLDALNDKLSAHAILNVVTGGKKFDALISVGVGRMHYGPTRWVGTVSDSAANGYAYIPRDGEVRDGDEILVVGAGGPMGQMHVIRNICSGKKVRRVVAADIDDARLASLRKKAEPMARASGVEFETVNTKNAEPPGEFTYFAIMAPIGALVEYAAKRSKPGAIVNIFAGIPAPVRHDLDLNTILEKHIFLYGTSGSTLDDMKIVLKKVTEGSLDTDASIDAISGMAGAIEGIKAVEGRTLAGKIVVYPMLGEVGLIPLNLLDKHFPTVAAKLQNGQWCKSAEDELLKVALEK